MRVNDLPDEGLPAYSPWLRWFHAITGHYAFLICLSISVCISMVPGVFGCYCLYKTNNPVFILFSVILFGFSGPVWAAVNHSVRQLQFGFPCYRFREFLKSIKENFKHGYCLSLLVCSSLLLIAAPFIYAEIVRAEMPMPILCLSSMACILLTVLATYSFYQIIRWEVTIRSALKNSLIFMVSLGMRSLFVAVLWCAFWIGLLLFPYVTVTASIFLSLPVMICITTQSIYVPQMEELVRLAKTQE